MKNPNFDIEKLSPHLFWDVDIRLLNLDKHKMLVVKRVLEYGSLNDWVQIYRYYGLDEIAAIALEIKELDARTLSFISLITKIPKEQFRCFDTKQSMPQHWNFY